jgi:hypothetical protein
MKRALTIKAFFMVVNSPGDLVSHLKYHAKINPPKYLYQVRPPSGTAARWVMSDFIS